MIIKYIYHLYYTVFYIVKVVFIKCLIYYRDRLSLVKSVLDSHGRQKDNHGRKRVSCSAANMSSIRDMEYGSEANWSGDLMFFSILL